jgi:hypothetical protein
MVDVKWAGNEKEVNIRGEGSEGTGQRTDRESRGDEEMKGREDRKSREYGECSAYIKICIPMRRRQWEDRESIGRGQ